MKLHPFVNDALAILQGLSCFGQCFAHYTIDVNSKTILYDNQDMTGVLKWTNLMSKEGQELLINIMYYV